MIRTRTAVYWFLNLLALVLCGLGVYAVVYTMLRWLSG